jgi:HlyD family secretion protein
MRYTCMVGRNLRTIIVLVLIAAAGAGVIAYRRAHQVQPAKFLTSNLERGRIVARVTATGTLSALVTVTVGAQVSGRIAEIKVDFNSPVKKGQLIAKIDPQLFLAAVEQAKANLAQQTAQHTQAQVAYHSLDLIRLRDRELRKQNLIAQQQLDTDEAAADAAKANIDVQAAQMQQAKATLHQAEVNLDYTNITSPTDGTVISRSVDVGQTVASALQAPTLFTIAKDLTKMQVDTNVAEADVGKLTASMEASFTVDAYPTEKFKGKVRQIRNAPQTVQNVVTYDAVIDVDNTALKLKPGMTANVTFVYAEKDDVLKVPNAALRFKPAPELLGKPDGGAPRTHVKRDHSMPDQRQVYVLRGDQPKMVSIKVGVSDGSVTEVVDGDLKVGDPVITDTLSTGADGKKPPTGFRGF